MFVILRTHSSIDDVFLRKMEDKNLELLLSGIYRGKNISKLDKVELFILHAECRYCRPNAPSLKSGHIAIKDA